MVIYGGVWCCIWVYGDVLGCMVMYQEYTVLYMGIWCCVGVYGDVQGCMVMYRSI